MTEKELIAAMLEASEKVFSRIAEKRGKFYVKENFEPIASVVSITLATIMDELKIKPELLKQQVELKKNKSVKKMAEEQGVEFIDDEDEDEDKGGMA